MADDTSSADAGGERDPATQRAAVRERYGAIADASPAGDCCGGSTGCCDESGDGTDAAPDVTALGYEEADIEALATGADGSLGCGNPTAIAALEPGETVLDLGAGGGFDCFLAAREVGPVGQVIGVDMTPEMVERARENRETNDVSNVEFRLGEIEHLPVADGTVDVILSNCVVNLSPAKGQVFAEAARVLRPGGRLAISDVVQTAPFPPDVAADPDALAGCVAGAARVPELRELLADAGFEEISIEPEDDSAAFISEWDDRRDLSEYLVAATIEARNPGSIRQSVE